ncbi:AAA family ATPase [Micromonospora globbae]|uniref:AAA family ATPase n=1 Tax=Micromonospora globbae TaxID=1894969 RepID=UPI0037912920
MSTFVAAAPRVPSPRWPVPEERRTVTVLFADIVGSTALVDRLDPEDVRAVQRAYFDTVAGVLRRWHGVVEKYIGDAVMALFGARESDGFDAYRAVRAGLEIQRELDRRPLPGGATLRVRVGVATGEAVVDLGAARDGGHGAASGAVITTAARLQEYAPPGAVVCCAATHRATAGTVTYRRLTPVTVAGRVPPVGVWHAVGPAGPAAVRHDAPLVGRRRELAGARDRILRAVRDRSPRWVSVVGPAGSGRSRLLHDLVRSLDAVDGTPVRWCVASCPPYPDEPLAPVAQLLRALAGSGAPGAGWAGTLAGLLPPARLATALPALERLLDVPDGQATAGAAWCQELLLRVAARGPVVVAVDDLDRAAPAVDRFLHSLFVAAAARGLPLAVVTLHRPDRADVLPVAAQRHHRVPLRPLTPVQTGRLLRHLLIRAEQPLRLVTRLLPLVGGHPGHAAAYVGALADGDDRTLPPLPEALRRAVGAELDRLDGPHRAVLMAAAVLPPGFTADEVARVLDWPAERLPPALAALVAAGLLVPHPAGGHALASPALRRVAADRLPRRFRATFGQRAVDVVLSHRLRRLDPVGGPAAAPARPARRHVPPVHPVAAVPAPAAVVPGPRDAPPGAPAVRQAAPPPRVRSLDAMPFNGRYPAAGSGTPGIDRSAPGRWHGAGPAPEPPGPIAAGRGTHPPARGTGRDPASSGAARDAPAGDAVRAPTGAAQPPVRPTVALDPSDTGPAVEPAAAAA